jgi:hypothetical protein
MGRRCLLNVRWGQSAEYVSVPDDQRIGTQGLDARRCRRLPGAQAECTHMEGTYNLLAHYRAIRQWALAVGAAIICREEFCTDPKYGYGRSPGQLHS